MRILFITEYLPPKVSGIAERCKQYINGYRKLGHEVVVWGVSGCDLSDYNTLSIPMPANKEQRFALWDPRLLFMATFQKWDVIHIVTPGNINCWPILAIAKLRGIRTCVSYHVLLSYYGPRYLPRWFYPIGFAIVGFGYIGWITKMADVVALPSSAPLQDFRLGMPKKVYLMPCGVDTEKFYPLNDRPAKLKDEDGRWRISYVGRLAVEKDVQFLVEAFNNQTFLKNQCRLHIVGDGPDRTNIENCAKDLINQGIVVMHGMQYGEALRHAYADSALIVSASQSETFGFTNAEAMACSTPCVIVRAGAFPEVYKTLLRLGWMFEPHDKEDFVKKVEYVISNLEEFRKKAFNISQDEFSWDNAVRGMIENCYT